MMRIYPKDIPSPIWDEDTTCDCMGCQKPFVRRIGIIMYGFFTASSGKEFLSVIEACSPACAMNMLEDVRHA